jgi:hypothetical protein
MEEFGWELEAIELVLGHFDHCACPLYDLFFAAWVCWPLDYASQLEADGQIFEQFTVENGHIHSEYLCKRSLALDSVTISVHF